jgi:transposase-like protein
MGATADGTKELIAVVDGVRESELSWKEVLLNLKSRGLEDAPELAIGDGALGFWKALREVFPATREQRCTVHKTANVLNKLPKSLQPQAKRLLHNIWQAPTRAEPTRPLICSWKRSMRSTLKRPDAWQKIARHCSRFTTFRPRTGVTSEPRIRSKARSPRSGSDSERPEAAVQPKPL